MGRSGVRSEGVMWAGDKVKRGFLSQVKELGSRHRRTGSRRKVSSTRVTDTKAKEIKWKKAKKHNKGGDNTESDFLRLDLH